MKRLWGGRFASEPSPEMMAFTRSAHFDFRLAIQDCRVLAAHAAALVGAGVLGGAESDAAAASLHDIGEQIARGSFPVASEDEDVHSTVERALMERDAVIGSKIRAGLSRNDRVATAFRLWIAEAARELAALVAALRGVLEERAAEHDDTLMPGYTHLQRAQPVTLGYHLRAHGEAFARAEQRLIGAADGAMKSCPLGAGALAGSTLNLDRTRAADMLGFAAPANNSMDAVADRDFVATFLFAATLLGIGCSRLAEEIVLWTTSEFGFAELDDAWATGSSLMPQKKNPDIAELARGKAGRLIGDLTGLLATLKGLPLAYNRDLQEDKDPVFDAADTLAAMLPALGGLVRTLKFNSDRMRDAANDGNLLATDLAEYLVGKGVPFNEAHEAVGKASRKAADLGTALASLPIGELKSVHAEFDDDVKTILDPAESARRRLQT
ncbi:MAG: argininosuccinate lyase [Actinomycetota bacterium]|nr:argininosuccinate lyase [Actinomycetota bacterium]